MRLFKRDILALEWDNRQVRAVAARPGQGKLNVDRVFAEPVPAELASDDAVAFGLWLADVLARHNCSGMRTLVALPLDRAVLKNLSLPQVPEAEVAALVQFQMQKELPFAAEEAVIDYTLGRHLGGANGNGNGHAAGDGIDVSVELPEEAGPVNEILVAATRKEVVEYYRAVADGAGLHLARIGLRCFCNLQTVRTCLAPSPDSRLLLVDVGPEFTEIDVMQDRSLLFSRSASVHLVGPDDDFEEGEEPDYLNRLALEVSRSVQAARATQPGLDLDELVLAAPGHLADAVAQELSRRLELPCQVLDPGSRIDMFGLSGADAGPFSAVLGLALGQMAREQTPFDFLHPHKPVNLQARRKKRRRLAATAALTAVAVAFLINQIALSAERTELAKRRGDVTRLQEQAKAVRKLGADVRTIRNARAAAPNWIAAHYARINHLWAEDNEFHKGVHLTRFDASLEGKNNSGWRIILTGMTEREKLANDLERKIRAAYDADKRKDLDVSVKVEPKTTRGRNARTYQQFTLTIRKSASTL